MIKKTSYIKTIATGKTRLHTATGPYQTVGS